MRYRRTFFVTLAAVAIASCGDDATTTTSTDAGGNALSPATSQSVSPECEEAAQSTVAEYGKIDSVVFSAELSGEEIARWTSSRTPTAVTDDVPHPVVSPESLGLKSDEHVEVCIYRGTFANAVIPGPQGTDLGVVTEIGMLVRDDGTIQVSYLRPERAEPVELPDTGTE